MKKKYIVTGETFKRKEKLKAAGYKYDAEIKAWIGHSFRSDSIWRYEPELVFTEFSRENLEKIKSTL